MTTSKAVHSQAFGLTGSLQGSVDPRTGQFTLSFDIPEVRSNWLAGPEFPVGLAFSPINTLDSGYGLGWNLNLTQYTPHNSILALHTGETFKVTGSGLEPAIKEKKLDSFHFEDLGNDRYRVYHKSGLVEVLQVGGSSNDRVALPVEIYSPIGHCIKLVHVSFRGGQRLESISDAQGELLRINRPNDYQVEILVRPHDGPEGGPLARYEMNLNASGWVNSIVLPTDDKASLRMSYALIRGFLCLTEIKTPLGGRETVEYTDRGHPYPGGVTRPNLPRVTSHCGYPGFDQPMIRVDYSYTDHNFLGAGATVSWEEGMDPLYKVATHYEYGSIATLMDGNRVVRTVERIYSRFHLLIEEITTQQQCVKRVKTEYYAKDVPFEQQVPQFQLPQKVTASWELADDATQYRAEVTLSAYDEYGNQTERTEPNGHKTTYRYYAKSGEDGCPSDRFVRNLKEALVTPSPDGEPGALPKSTRLRYAAHKALTSSGLQDWLAIESETQVQLDGDNETTLLQTQRTYHELPGDAFLNGRPRTEDITIKGKTSRTSYTYERVNSALAGEAVLQVTELFTGFDGIEKSIAQQKSLITGETVLSTDPDGVQMLRTFDALGRVTREIVSPDFPDARGERTFSYALTSADGQQASQSMTEIGGATNLTCYDGQGRIVSESLADDTSTPARQTFTARYDALNNRVEEIRYDWLHGKSMALRRQFEYDAWGLASRTTGVDGSISHRLWSPFGRTGPLEYTWVQTPGAQSSVSISNLTGVEYNAFARIERSEQLDAQPLIDRCRQQPTTPVIEHLKQMLRDTALPTVGAVEYVYDGNSNCVLTRELYDQQEKTTGFAYDALNRVHTTTLPDKTEVASEFAEQSWGHQVTRMWVTPGNTAQPAVTVGRRKYDSLMRLTETSVGSDVNPRVEQYRYSGGQMQPSQRITALETFDLEYKPELTRQPVSIKSVKGQPATYSYDPKTGNIIRATNEQGQRTYKYSGSGRLIQENWTDTDNITLQTDYSYSLLGRQLSRRDSGTYETVITYDDSGRASTATQNALTAQFEYNALGQLKRTTTRNQNLVLAVTLVADLQYDTQGREIERVLSVTDQPTRTISQTWQGDNQLKSRVLSVDGRVLLTEEFVYDARNRLIEHRCDGASNALPRDAYGNAIKKQVFRFDGLDNVTRVNTEFDNRLTDDARFYYGADDPCQLTRLTHTYIAGGYAPEQSFDYDAIGNMLNDERNNRLVYDSQGRLIAVKDPTGVTTLVSYRYDGHNHLVGVTKGTEPETLRVYEGYNLSYTRQGNTLTQYLYDGNRPLGQQQVEDPTQTLLLMTDASPSVIGECTQTGVTTATYSAYGIRSSEEEMRTLLAFNSEVCEELTNWYLLGRGYRAYNPNLMRFHSPDGFSPFGAGGMNPYIYCLGNPITFRDPSGHRTSRTLPEDPAYVDPAEKQRTTPEGKIGIILGFIGALASSVLAIAFTLGLATPFVVGAAAGALINLGGIIVSTYGVINDDVKIVEIGAILMGVGSLISIFVGGAGYIKGRWFPSLDMPPPPGAAAARRGSGVGPQRPEPGPGPNDNGGRNQRSNSRNSSAVNTANADTEASLYIPEPDYGSDTDSNHIVRNNAPTVSDPVRETTLITTDTSVPAAPAPTRTLRSGREESDYAINKNSNQKDLKDRDNGLVVTTEGANRQT